jgi:hypothetical protein
LKQNISLEQWHCIEEKQKCFFNLFEEHSKPGCMVSCRTVQGQKGVQKDKRNQRLIELIRGCLVPWSTNFQKKHNESITAPPLPPSATSSAKKTQGGHCHAPFSSQKKHKAHPSSSSCNKFCQKNTRGPIAAHLLPAAAST